MNWRLFAYLFILKELGICFVPVTDSYLRESRSCLSKLATIASMPRKRGARTDWRAPQTTDCVIELSAD